VKGRILPDEQTVSAVSSCIDDTAQVSSQVRTGSDEKRPINRTYRTRLGLSGHPSIRSRKSDFRLAAHRGQIP